MSRTIFVGDVHGCAAELRELLQQIAFSSADRLVFVGDLIARGPDSLGVLDLVLETKSVGVLGNHEWRMLQVRAARRQGQRGPRLGPAHHRLFGELTERHWELLAGLPHHLDFPSHGVRVVHAGVQPDRPFDEQDPWTLLNIRTLRADGSATAEARFELWAQHYRQTPHIVFGHNSRASLQLHTHATGLDTACVYGGDLTALVLPTAAGVPSDLNERRAFLFSVSAAQRYYRGRSGRKSVKLSP